MKACQVAPPVALLSWIDKWVTVLVPLASLMVACVPGVVLCRYFSVVPVVTNEPTVLVVPAASWSVPLVIVNAPVTVKASEQAQVPPTPLKVTAAGNDTPFDVIVFVPDVAEKVRVPVPVSKVTPP